MTTPPKEPRWTLRCVGPDRWEYTVKRADGTVHAEGSAIGTRDKAESAAQRSLNRYLDEIAPYRVGR